jgi:hypothetical protein
MMFSATATAERLVLSGGLLNTNDIFIQGEPYSRSVARSVNAAVTLHRRAGNARLEKVDALVEFMNTVSEEHVLVFCVHRAVARAISDELNHWLGYGSVRTAIGAIDRTVRSGAVS